MDVHVLTDETFKTQVEQTSGVALVDFWAPWCMPCSLVSPTVERLSKEFAGRVHVGKLNIDEYPDVAGRYGIMSIPTIGVFRGGKLVNMLVGVRPEAVYQRALAQALEAAEQRTTHATATRPAGAAQAAHQVTVFSTPTCPWCARLKSYLKQQRVAFNDVDVSRDTRAANEMVRRSGQMGVPQAWIDGKVVVGFDRAKVDHLLGLAQAGARP